MKIRISYLDKNVIAVVDQTPIPDPYAALNKQLVDIPYFRNSQEAIIRLQRLLEKKLTHAEASRFSVVFIMNLIMLPVGTSLIIEIPK